MVTHHNNKLYDTEKARPVFTGHELSLYRKRTGEFFSCDGQRIKPLTFGEAQMLVRDHAPEIYDKVFGVRDDGKKIVASVSLSKTSMAILNRLTAETGKSRSDVIDSLLLEWGQGRGQKSL